MSIKTAQTRIRTLSDLRTFLESDLHAAGLQKWRPWYGFKKPGVVYLRTLRIVEYLETRSSRPERLLASAARYRLSVLSVRTGLSVPPHTFGRGLGLPHYGSIVVHSRARFGDFCVIQNAVNIGVLDDGVPSGGDFIYFAPGAVVYGAVTIGSEAVVGANSVLNASVPRSTVWGGAPARQIRNGSSYPMMIASVRAVMDARAQPATDTSGR